MTPLEAQIVGQLREMRVPLTITDLVHRLGGEPADILIALHNLTRTGRVRSKLRGPMQRPHYELA